MIFTTSWDDGSVFDYRLLKLLKPLGIKGTLYIPQNAKYRTLHDKDVRNLSEYFEIGAHSISHADLTTLDKIDLKEEVQNSKIYIEKITNQKCVMFGYPYGNFNTEIEMIVKEVKYKGTRIVNKDFCEGSLLNDFQLPVTLQVCKHTKEKTIKFNVTPSSENSISVQFLKNLHAFEINDNNEYNWLNIAKFIYKEIQNKNGVFHLWGHSWEIEEQNLWNELEEFLVFIVKDKNTIFIPNSELIKF